ncbi:MltA domain-containing protein [Sansalvadorimonas sp. 2012CJ34-2]|uniref:Membrane-bound lytic murein transglycosylase A n=1 Tax=Parendozoicomonas callyspongiae TaxID=2942213 RepID=A0ABT0PJ76_9GAMM|nr:MltA domain-containing protein [Sansalvadorimonas sp. 2012CJ34-2]MCL6271291.1 MltA domain-containing protein [Sansalvadorimonas sp. 2012CJ34-2]
MKITIRQFSFIFPVLVLSLLSGCSLFQSKDVFQPSSFSELNGWNQTQAVGLKTALQESCPVYLKRTGPVNPDIRFGTYEQWHRICDALDTPEDDALPHFFETALTVYQVAPWEKGLFTGYFTPLLHGSRTRSERYAIPLLDVPDDLVFFNPQDFDLERTDKTKPHRMKAGKAKNGWLVPYEDRQGINRRATAGDYDNDVLFWLDDRVDRFFLQIQGSGTIELDTGEQVEVRISGRNGHEYFAIGRYLKRNGLLEKVSMQSIRQWLEDNPDRMDEVLYTNPDFIFFSKLNKPGPLGAQGTKLIPEHSAAVDDRVIPLGTPLWLSTTLTADDQPFARAMVAQDVGSAIRGQARADIFFGAGEEAARKAGHQNAGGKLFVLLPKQMPEED